MTFPRRRSVPLVVAAALVMVAVPRLAAQEALDESTPPRIRLGPLGLTPALALLSTGVDNNVFNETSDPKQDLTATFAPTLDTLFRARRLSVRVRSSAEFVFFRRYEDQRAINTTQDATLGLRLHRVTPFVFGSYVNSRERPSLEIDTRVRRMVGGAGLGADVRLSSRLVARVQARRLTTTFEDSATFEGVNLQEQLNQTATQIVGSLRYELTPLTRLVLLVEPQRDRFEFTPLRDADSTRVSPGVEFGATALISGRAYVGVRAFNARDGSVPDYTGVVASLDLSYVFRGTTRFSVHTDRDIAYSFDPTTPYYLLTGVGLTITQRVSRNVDVTAFGSRQQLTYHGRLAIPVDPPMLPPPMAPVEPAGVPPGEAYTAGAGIGFRFGRSSRIGFNVDHSARPSGRDGHSRNLRLYTTVNYGF